METYLELSSLAQQKREFDAYTTYCINKRRAPKKEFASSQSMQPGQVVRASNCDYEMQENGSLRRIDISEAPSRQRSQLYVPVRANKKDKYGNLRLT